MQCNQVVAKCSLAQCGLKVWCGVVWCAEGAVTRRQRLGCLACSIAKRAGVCAYVRAVLRTCVGASCALASDRPSSGGGGKKVCAGGELFEPLS